MSRKFFNFTNVDCFGAYNAEKNKNKRDVFKTLQLSKLSLSQAQI